MPPCAATVWLRVGNTLVMQATFSPSFAASSVARRPGAAGADDDDVEGVIDDRIGRHAGAPTASFRSAKPAAAPMPQQANRLRTSSVSFMPS